MTKSNDNRLESQPSPLDAVRGRYPQPSLSRWSNTIFAVIWLPLGVGQLLKGQWPLGLVLGTAFGLVAVLAWMVPAARIDEAGVRLRTKPVIPWSQVSDVDIPVDNGWKLPPAELVLVDGKRKPLAMLSQAEAVTLREHVLQEAPAGATARSISDSGLEGEYER